MLAPFNGYRVMTVSGRLVVRKLILASIFIRIDCSQSRSRGRSLSFAEIEAAQENKLIPRETIFFFFFSLPLDLIDVQ